MAELIALFALIVVSLLIVRVGTVALEKTGLSRDVAAFQAQSAFMGVGFTTSESEAVVGHPVRRRVVRTLMLLGFGAITSTLGTAVITFAQHSEGGLDNGNKILILLGFVVAVAVFVHVPAFDKLVDHTISKALESVAHIEEDDLHELLNLDKGYAVATIPVGEGSWLGEKNLRQLALADEGVLVLHIERASGVVIATPAARTRLHVGDELLMYGLEDDLAGLRERSAGPAGDQAHAEAVARTRVRMVGERSADEAAG